ncbi:Uncharacterised protein [Chlamydia trachomatis]|nr:Uncharacterised protein [Chlamydia trachomatis]CRH69289.1 Uncharacterised protein [Chlamydia trachomatis]
MARSSIIKHSVIGIPFLGFDGEIKPKVFSPSTVW